MDRSWQQASERGDAGALRSAIEAGAYVDARDRYGRTALMITAHAGHLEASRVLVEAGADLDHTAKYRLSALMLATLQGHESIVRLLAEAGADLALEGSGAPGFAGKTALDLALDLERTSIAELLLELSERGETTGADDRGSRSPSAEAAALSLKIARIFAEVPFPGPDGLLHPECLDANPVQPFLDQSAWQNVPREILCRDYDALSFFGPEAFRFFLPAFMTVTLALFRESTEHVSDATVFELVPHSDYARSRYVLFTPAEKAVVAEFLELMASSPRHADVTQARAALEGFWGTPGRHG